MHSERPGVPAVLKKESDYHIDLPLIFKKQEGQRNTSLHNKEYRWSEARFVSKRGRVKIYLRHIPQKSMRYVKDLGNTLVNLQWRWVILIVTLVNLTAYFTCALIFYWDSWLSGDFETDQKGQGLCMKGTNHAFAKFFMLGIETITTTGYGYWHPTENCNFFYIALGFSTLISILIDGIFISVVYVKLNRTKTFTFEQIFSRKAVVSFCNEKLCLIFRLNDRDGKHWISTAVRLYLLKQFTSAEGEIIPNFVYELKTKPHGMLFLPVEIIHEIDQHSPLWDMSAQEFMTTKIEIIAVVSGSSIQTGQSTVSQTSYLNKDIMWGYTFSPCLEFNNKLELVVNKRALNHTVPQEVPLCSAKCLNKLQNQIAARRNSMNLNLLLHGLDIVRTSRKHIDLIKVC
ncbi:inward rectifier potassium channel 2-like isoform X2 [Cylas formicarius]|uniref:inward rectifier potassium channel 2-like isoform X2 n=1 Tax=Cylas formicarius TaxID=197179 RepID=UPI002958D2C5|nr:inward rectifier potassium channel 2-like isoform X2 [Cylas formicarius]